MESNMFIFIVMIIGIMLAVLITFFVFRKINAITPDRIKLGDIENIPIYNCPKCGEKMENGFSRSNGIVWRNSTESPFGSYTRRKDCLENTLISLTGRENIAWHCHKCKLILIDHSVVVVVR